MSIIITHVSPDFDAIGAVWLLRRYLFRIDSVTVLFVHTGSPDRSALAQAAAVVDTGREYDPARLRFDHHQLPGAAANETCATLQVAQHLVLARPDIDFTPIWPLIDLIYAGDTGKPAANESRRIGVHALLSAYKTEVRDDAAILGFGITLLDRLASHLEHADEARASLEAHTVYRSADGLLIALRDAPRAASYAEHEAGARLVVFANYEQRAIGVLRGGEGVDVSCGDLVHLVWREADGALAAELVTWYRHEAGFFAGRGTEKAPSDMPIAVDVVDVARALDRAWRR